jgi:hypothetical protein
MVVGIHTLATRKNHQFFGDESDARTWFPPVEALSKYIEVKNEGMLEDPAVKRVELSIGLVDAVTVRACLTI